MKNLNKTAKKIKADLRSMYIDLKNIIDKYVIEKDKPKGNAFDNYLEYIVGY